LEATFLPQAAISGSASAAARNAAILRVLKIEDNITTSALRTQLQTMTIILK
jgi:hypothetical protein